MTQFASGATVYVRADSGQFVQDLQVMRLAGQRFVSDLRTLGSQLARGTILAGGTLALAVREFALLDKELRAIRGITGEVGASLGDLETKVRTLGATTSFTAQEVALAAKELARGGQSIAQIEKTLPAVLDLARGTGTDLAFAASSTVRVLGQFQLGAEEARRVVDVLAKAANSGTFVLEDLGESLKFLGPIAETVGESVESASAAFAVLANNGLRGGIAGRQLRRVLFELADTAKQQRIGELFDIDVTDAAGNLRPLVDLIDDIGGALQELPTGRQTQLLDEIFGEGAAAFAGLAKGVKDVRLLNAELLITDGYAEQLRKDIEGGVFGAFKFLISAIQEAAQVIGQSLDKEITDLLLGFRELVLTTASWLATNKDLVKTLLTITLALSGVTAGVLAIAGTVGGVLALVKAFSLLGTAATFVATAFAVPFVGAPAVFGGALAAAAGLNIAYNTLSGSIEGANARLGETVDETSQLLGLLTQLSQQEVLDLDSLAKAEAIVTKLEDKFGDLGVVIDDASGKIKGVEEAAARVSAAQSVANNKKRVEELLGEFGKLKEEEAKLIEEGGNGVDTPDEGFVFTSGPGVELQRQIEDLKARIDIFKGFQAEAQAELDALDEAEASRRVRPSDVFRSGFRGNPSDVLFSGLGSALGVFAKDAVKDAENGASTVADAFVLSLRDAFSGRNLGQVAGAVGDFFSSDLKEARDRYLKALREGGDTQTPGDEVGAELDKLSVASRSLASAFRRFSSPLAIAGDTLRGFFTRTRNEGNVRRGQLDPQEVDALARQVLGRIDQAGLRDDVTSVEQARDLNRRQASATVDVLTQTLEENKKQSTRLTEIRKAIEKRRGLPVR